MRAKPGPVTTILFSSAVLLLIAANLAGRGAAQTAPAAEDANTEILSLGPAPQTGGFASIRMTRDFRSIAIAGNSGSRMAAFLNGAPGAKYDQVQTVPPVLSADGKHVAYAARKSGNWFAIVDDKEFGPYMQFPSYGGFPYGGARPIPWQDTPNRPILFSPDSKHFAFIANKAQPQNPNPLWVVVEDGKEMAQPGQVDMTVSLQFSAHGDHLMWIVHGKPNGTSSVVLDGIEGPAYSGIYQPQFSEDGHHLAYTAQRLIPPTQGGGSQFVEVLDGKEGPVLAMVGSNAYGNGVLLSPDGAHLVYPAHQKTTAANQNGLAVVIDGKVISDANRVWMSPDGKTIAYESLPANGNSGSRAVLVINGKPGLEYSAIQDVRFAPDDRVIYSVRAANGKFFVVDGEKELGPYDSVDLGTLRFSADHKHWAYAASGDGRAFAVFDGRKLRDITGAVQNATPPGLPYPFDANDAREQMFKFTADGHLLYHASTGLGSGFMKDDESLGADGLMSPDGRRIAVVKSVNQGSSAATAQLTLDGQAGPAFREITRMAFSPDSKHFAYVGISTVPVNGTGKEGGYILMVDGVRKGDYPEISDVQFSPDSQHLFHFTTSHLFGGPGRAYMDQKLFFTFYWLPGYFAHWLDDHRTLQILGGKYDAATYRAADDQMYRVRYYLPGANRKQQTAAIAGPAAVDLAEAKNMVGGGLAAASASPSAAPAAAASAAGGTPGAAGTPSSAAGASAGAPSAPAIPAGTSITVRIIDAVDSGQYSAGKTYRAVVTQAVNAGTVNIPQNTLARVTLVQNGNAWIAQLASLTLAGKQVNVSSSTATINSTPQSTAQSAANAIGSAFGRFGKHPQAAAAAATVAAAASGARVYLPPGTILTFVVSG